MPAHRKNLANPIWSPELAYIVGLLVTDGNLSKDGRHLNFRSSDMDLILTVKRLLTLQAHILENSNDTYAKKPCYRLDWSDITFYNWLVSIGLMPAKSLIIGAIDVPDRYFRDFLRGHLDGDGTVMSYIDKSNFYHGRNYIAIRLYLKFISASRLHLEWLLRQIRLLALVHGSFESKMTIIGGKAHYIYTIKFSKNEALKLLDWIYYQEDLPSLQRKSGFARQLMAEIPMLERKEYIRVN